MPLDETLATYSHFIREADATKKLAYVCLSRYAAKMDSTFDGVLRATQHDVVASYGPLLQNTPLLLNADLSPSEAVTLIQSSDKEKKIDAGVFGWLHIANPDLAKRLEGDVPLEMNVDVKHLYGSQIEVEEGKDVVEAQRVGYSAYPFATEVKL